MSKKPTKEIYKEIDSQERLIREIMSKEILKKIERRVDNKDENVIKTVRQVLDEDNRR